MIFHVKGPGPEAVSETESQVGGPTVFVLFPDGKRVNGFVMFYVQP